MQPLIVKTATQQYPIFFSTDETWRGLARELKRRFPKNQLGIVTSPTLAKHHLLPLQRALKAEGLPHFAIRIPDGESKKTLHTVSRLYALLARHKVSRGDPLIALGGGVIGDMVGFAAATYLRGLPYIQVPTTLLAQVDSSVGGKTGVDAPWGKNVIGAFYQPQWVWIALHSLSTLPPREIRAGFAEIIKYGAIWDAKLFRDLCRFKPSALPKIIRRSVEIKAEIVGQDEREESGLRSLLNFGHTVGHAVEAATRYRRYRHGEAVAIGMATAARLSRKMGLLNTADETALIDLIRAFGLETELPLSLAEKTLLDYMRRDKKGDRRHIRFVVLSALGKAQLATLSYAELAALLKGIR